MKEKKAKSAGDFKMRMERLKEFGAGFVDRLATAIVKKRLLFLIIFVVMFVLGLVGLFFVNTNYDATAYLPSDCEVKRGLKIMSDEFGKGGNAALMIEDVSESRATVSYESAVEFKAELEKIDGVASVMWVDDLMNGFTDKLVDESLTEDEKNEAKLKNAQAALLMLNVLEQLGGLEKVEKNVKAIPFFGDRLFSDLDLKDPKNIENMLNGVFLLSKSKFEKEIKKGIYSFSDRDEGEEAILNLVRSLASSGTLDDVDVDSVKAKDADELLNGFAVSVKMFYSSDPNSKTGAYSPLYQIAFEDTDYSKKTQRAIDEIRDKCDANKYAPSMSGNAATTYNSIDCVNTQTVRALIAVAIVVLVILFLFSTSFWEPILYLAAIGIAVVINMGSNVVMGSVSYLTSGVAGILQLALSMDYSIFLLTRFRQEKQKNPDVEQAMINAIKASLNPISASSLTTIASFVALMFMRYTIGLDMGIVFAKGVIFSLLSVFMFLPGLAIYTNKLIVKSTHKSFKFRFRKPMNAIMKARFAIPAVMLVLIVLGAVGQNYMRFGYGDEATFGSRGSLLYEEKQKIERYFGSQNQLAILLKKEAAERKIDGPDADVETAITADINAEKSFVLSAQSISAIEAGNMDKLLPEKFLGQFVGEEYNRLIVYLNLPEEGKNAEGVEVEGAMAEIRGIFKARGVDSKDYFFVGGSSSAIEIKGIVKKDYAIITWCSIGLVLFILLCTFRSAILPFLLVFVIQGSVWISMSISVLTKDVLVFIGYLIVSTIMLGATIDYGILLTSNYLENRRTRAKIDAIRYAAEKSSRAIFTSSVILICAGAVLTLLTEMPAFKDFGLLISRTAATSLCMVLILLPCLLVIFDRLIEKTTLFGFKFFVGPPEAEAASRAVGSTAPASNPSADEPAFSGAGAAPCPAEESDPAQMSDGNADARSCDEKSAEESDPAQTCGGNADARSCDGTQGEKTDLTETGDGNADARSCDGTQGEKIDSTETCDGKTDERSCDEEPEGENETSDGGKDSDAQNCDESRSNEDARRRGFVDAARDADATGGADRGDGRSGGLGTDETANADESKGK